jgi:hypothetical protein
MQTVSLVFAVTAAIAASLLICLQGLKEIIGHHRWLSAIKFILCLLVLFGGPVAAADATFWSFVVGGVLSCAAGGLLVLKMKGGHQWKEQPAKALAELCPKGAVPSRRTFNEALAVHHGLAILMFVD